MNAWTLGPEVFESFPDLYGVAPAFNGIPRNVDEVSVSKEYSDYSTTQSSYSVSIE